MLSTIVWTNRNTFSGANDNHFDEAFDVISNGVTNTNYRNLAIADVDAAIQDWENVIDSFNYTANPSTVFQVKISMDPTATGAGAGAQSAFTTNTGYTGTKPSSATITIGWRSVTPASDYNGNWYLDPSPNDVSEFRDTSTDSQKQTNAFFQLTTGGSHFGIDCARPLFHRRTRIGACCGTLCQPTAVELCNRDDDERLAQRHWRVLEN